MEDNNFDYLEDELLEDEEKAYLYEKKWMIVYSIREKYFLL